MKWLVGNLDMFISPLTGKLRSLSQFPSLGSQGYIIIGDYQGNAIASPALIDVRLDIIELRSLLQRLSDLKFILQSGNFISPNAQALDQLTNGFLYNNANGILSIEVPGAGTLALPHNQVFLGDVDDLAQPSPTILMDNLPDVPYQNLLIANLSNRLIPTQRIGLINLPPFLSPLPIDPLSVPPGAPVNFGLYNLYTGGLNPSLSEPIAPTTTLRIDKSNLPNLSKGKIYMGAINIIPPTITFIPDPPYVTVAGNLNWDVRGALPLIGDNYAVPTETGLDPGTIFMGDFLNPGQITQTGLPFGRMFIGNGFGQITNVGLLPFQLFSGNPDASGQIIPITILDRTNLPILPLDNIWVGDGLDQAFPIPVGIGLNTVAGLNISDTGVVAGIYRYATFTVNLQGQLLEAIDNFSDIQDMQDNIADNTSNIASNTTSINTINTTLFDPITGIVTAVGLLNVAVFAPFTGILAIIGNWSNSTSISDVIGTWTSSTSIGDTVNNNTSNIATNSAAIASIIGTIIPSLPVRAACRASTTSNLNSTYNNGSSGVGATLTNNGTQAALIMDGITLSVNDRILIKNQTNTYQNGIYAVTDIGSSSSNWIIERTPDFDGSPAGAISEGTSLWISEGTLNKESFWMETGGGPFTVGTTPIIFTGYPGQSSITKVGTLTQGTWNADILELPFGGTNANLTAINGGIVYSTSSALAISAAPVVNNEILMGHVGGAPVWSNASYPSTILPNQILYGSALNVISALPTAANSTLVTDASGNISFSTTLPTAVQGNITSVGTLTSGTWNASIIPLQYGGSGSNLTASNGGMVYSTATALAILAGTAIANQIILSGANSSPSWSSATYPSTTTINQLLYSSAANTITGLATAINGVLITNGSGVPSISSTLPSAVQGNITSVGTLTSGTWNASIIPLQYGGTGANLTPSAGSIVYSTGTALALSAPTGANKIFMSGTGTIPVWSAAVYPAITNPSQLLYSSGANNVVGLATANNATLMTNSSGIPAWQTTSTNFVTSIAGMVNQITASASTGAITLSLPASVVITTSIQAGNLQLTGNTLQSTNSNGNILITPNGTGITSFTNNVGFGTSTPHSIIQTSNTLTNRLLTLWEENNNNHEYYGFGINAGLMRYQVFAGASHVWYVSTSSTTSTEIMRCNIVGSAGGLGVGGISPSYTGDFNGPLRSKRLLGNGNLISFSVLSGAGTGATASVAGSEVAGQITLTLGTLPPGGNVLQFTLSSAMPDTNYSVVLQPTNQVTVQMTPWVVINSTTQFTIVFPLSILSGGSIMKWRFVIVGAT